MRRLLHALQARDVGLVVWRFERYVHTPMGDHDGHTARGYLFTSIVGHVASSELP
jgi:hypothetical protein